MIDRQIYVASLRPFNVKGDLLDEKDEAVYATTVCYSERKHPV